MGDHALLILVDDARTAAALRTLVMTHGGATPALARALPREVVPAAETVLLDGLPGRVAQTAWSEWVAAVSADALHAAAAEAAAIEVVLETTYDGADLATVAEAWGCSQTAVVRRHTAAAYTVAFCGFAPGFAYCVAMDPLPVVPRRDSPRERVPAGSVALAGEYCGVYPAAMPGGWQLVGRTAAVLFDAARPEPGLLRPGVRVRFRAVG